MPFNWKSLAGNPLITFWVGNTAYTYCDDGSLSQWNGGAPTRYSKDRVENIDRVVFHDNGTRAAPNKGGFLLGFNTIGSGNFSQAKLEHNALILFTSIRCVLQGREEPTGSTRLGEAVSIQARFDQEQLLNLWVSHSTQIDTSGKGSVDVLRPPGSTRRKTLKVALSDMASGVVAPLRLGERQSANDQGDKNTYNEIETHWSQMLQGLLGTDPKDVSNFDDYFPQNIDAKGPALSVTFQENDRNKGQYVIEFEAWFADAFVQGIKCLAIKPSAVKDERAAQFDLANDPKRRSTWFFRQRSSLASCQIASRAEVLSQPDWTLELECLSQGSTAQHLRQWTSAAIGGIKAYGGATGVSFLPHLAPPAKGSGTVFTAIYQITDRCMDRAHVSGIMADPKKPQPDGKTVVNPLSVQYVAHRFAGRAEDPAVVVLYFPLCETTRRKLLAVTAFLTTDSISNRDTLGGFNFHSVYPLYKDGEVQSVRMGSIELAFGARGTPPGPNVGDVYFRLPDPGPQLAIAAKFIVNALLPGGQDDLPEDSFAAPNAVVQAMPVCRTGITPQGQNPTDVAVEEQFYRPRPLLINRNNSTNAPLVLTVSEQSGPNINRTVRLSVDVDNSIPGPPVNQTPQQTLVLDADPFLVAQISFPQLLSQAGSNTIAVWSNADATGARWQIPLTKSGFRLTLPSQVMGEEMVKAKGFQQPPIDFRLGPPATVAMEAGPQLTAYAEVPWNLRRILGYAGQTSPGVQVNRLDYELLYGLSCDVSLPFVRLAEVFAVFGAIPGRLPSTPARPADRVIYQQWRENWAKLYRRYQARLAILEPQDDHVAGSMTIKHGMSCAIRYEVTDETQKSCSQTLGNALLQFAGDDSTSNKPYRLPFADLDDPITPTARGAGAPLRGGVTWGFESRNIFCATLRNRFSTADSAAVSDLDFTALGGFGHQQASFDEGRTSIFGDAAMGRTYFYKLERIGRIAVFWNKAKHVIVYERSVVPSRQFYNEQDDGQQSYGIPMLRKVEEYIEILEEERRFPDDHVLTNATGGNGTPAQRCGCVAACVFQKGARIPVSSAWGSDVNTHTGGAGPTPVGWKVPLWKRGAMPADVYPFPKISLSVYSDFGGSSKESPCDVANPEGVYFYTDTREGTGSDTDKWGAILSVDTTDVPAAPPVQVSKSAIVPTAGDVPVPAGFSVCTFKLLPPLRAANIVANRVSTAMAVSLDSVTMMRGCTAPKAIGIDAPELNNVISTYASAWESELQGLAPAGWTKDNLLKAAGRIQSSVQVAVAAAQKKVTGAWKDNWQTPVRNFNNSALGRFSNQLLTGTSDGSSVTGGIQQVQKDVAAALATMTGAGDYTAQLQQLVEEQFGAIQRTVLDASATPGVLSTLLVQYYTAANGITTKAKNGIQKLQNALTQLPPDARSAVMQLTGQMLELRSDLMSTWSAASTARPLPELVDVADGLLTGPLKDFGDKYRIVIDGLAPDASTAVNEYANKLVKLKKQITDLAPIVTSDLTNLAVLLKLNYSSSAPGPLTFLDYFRYDLTFVDTDRTKTWAGGVYDKLSKAASSGAGAVANVQKEFNDAVGGFNQKLADLQTAVSGEIDGLGNKVIDAINGIKADAANTLTNLADALKNALQNLPDPTNPQQLADIQKAVLQFRDAQLAEAHQYADKYLGLFRSAAADVTSNTNQLLSLVRCFGDAPVANTLDFLPGKIGYYFGGLPTQVDLSPVTSILRQAGNIVNDASGVLNDAINVMHLQVPAVSLADRIVPPDLSGIKLSDIFPKFAGIDLSNLFQGINLGETGDKIRISHGTDPQALTAWVQGDIGAHLQDVPVFDTGGVSLRLQTADFAGQVRVDVSPQGTRQAATGSVIGDWALLVLGQQVVTLSATQLLFDSSGKLQFKVDPKNVKLPGVLSFVTTYLSPFLQGGNGLSVQLQGTQVVALLNLPIPDVSGLTSGIPNLSLSCKFAVGLVNGKFQLDVGFGLSDPLKPFNVAFFILGGAGYLNATASFAPSDKKPPSCTVDFGIMASASLAIAFGPISGGVYAFFGIQAGFTTGGPGFNIAAVLILRGQVNLAGIISASVCMELAASYDGHRLTGSGYFSISITICWCFTLNISVGISYPIGSFGGQSTAQIERHEANRILLASAAPGGFDPDFVPAADGGDELSGLIQDYVAMTKGM